MRFFAKAICRFSHVVYCSWACFVLVTSCLPAGKMYLLTFYRWDCQHQMNRRNKMSLKSKIFELTGIFIRAQFFFEDLTRLFPQSNSHFATIQFALCHIQSHFATIQFALYHIQFTLCHNSVRPMPHAIHTLTQSSSPYATCNSHFDTIQFALCHMQFTL